MGFTSHRGFESRPLRSLRSVRRPHRVAAILGERLAPVAQLDRASVYGTEGHRFESCRARRGSPATAGLLGFLEPNLLTPALGTGRGTPLGTAREGRFLPHLIPTPLPSQAAAVRRTEHRGRRFRNHANARARQAAALAAAATR